MRCSLCRSSPPAPTPPSPLRTLVDFLFLYLIGVYELCRQWLNASKRQADHVSSLCALREHKPVILITGCTSGIGLELLHQFLNAELHVIALVREISTCLPRQCQQYQMDLSSLSSTERACCFVLQYMEQEMPGRHAILVHCAGVYYPASQSPVTNTLLINFVIPTVLIARLDPVLQGVLWLGSSAQASSPRITDSQCPLHTAQSPYAMYPLSKLLALLYLENWSLTTGKPALIIHPGVVATNLYTNERGLVGIFIRALMPYFAWDSRSAAERVLQVCDAASLWRLAVETQRFSDPPSFIYWDAASLKPGLLPKQIRNPQVRAQVVQKISAALALYISSLRR